MLDTDLDSRYIELKEVFVARLSRVRGALTDAEFEQLVANVMRTATRFVAIEKSSSPSQRLHPKT